MKTSSKVRVSWRLHHHHAGRSDDHSTRNLGCGNFDRRTAHGRSCGTRTLADFDGRITSIAWECLKRVFGLSEVAMRWQIKVRRNNGSWKVAIMVDVR